MRDSKEEDDDSVQSKGQFLFYYFSRLILCRLPLHSLLQLNHYFQITIAAKPLLSNDIRFVNDVTSAYFVVIIIIIKPVVHY